jgi:hypothetical protein
LARNYLVLQRKCHFFLLGDLNFVMDVKGILVKLFCLH